MRTFTFMAYLDVTLENGQHSSLAAQTIVIDDNERDARRQLSMRATSFLDEAAKLWWPTPVASIAVRDATLA